MVAEQVDSSSSCLQKIDITSTRLLSRALGWLLDHLTYALSKTNTSPNVDMISGDWTPVARELQTQKLQYEGSIPRELLGGVYMRNGSNPLLKPYAGYHLFEGDGMVHATMLKEDGLYYSNHSVRTYRYQRERAAGRPLWARVGDMQGLRGVALALLDMMKDVVGYFDTTQGSGQANTSVLFHAGRVMALVEADLPYQVKVLCQGLVETLGRLHVGNWDKPFTAHPKLDPETGHLHFFGYDIKQRPYLQYGELDPRGKLVNQVAFPQLEVPVMMHDCVITQHHAILPVMPLVFDPQHMVKNGKIPIVFRKDLPSVFYVLRFGSKVPIKVEFDCAFYVFHFANAWEEGEDIIKVYGWNWPWLTLDGDPNEITEFGIIAEYTLDLKTGKGSMRELTREVHCEFPVVHPAKVGRRCRYAFTCYSDRPTVLHFDGICKVDFGRIDSGESVVVAKIPVEPGLRVGEAVFVPRRPDVADADEDDGFLLLYSTKGDTEESFFTIYDAKTMSSTPILNAKLPHRIAPGFHGTFVEARQLQGQVFV